MTKIAVFHLARLYRIKWQGACLPDFLHGARAMMLGSLAAMAMALLPVQHCSRAVLIIGFYLMSSLLLGMRLSVRLLEYYACSNPERKRKALIYGAGPTASLLMRELLSDDCHALTPVGSIDDDPDKRRKLVLGYPVLGACSALDEQLRNNGAQELIIAAPEVTTEQLARINNRCRANGVTVRRFSTALEEVSEQ